MTKFFDIAYNFLLLTIQSYFADIFVYFQVISCNLLRIRLSFGILKKIHAELMLTSHRKRLILDKLRAEGQVIAKSVSHELGLSEDTIRRDLRELAQEGLLQRVHGGALPASPAVADFAGRQLFGTEGKSAIRRTAAPLI